jgi:hypothetical protein
VQENKAEKIDEIAAVPDFGHERAKVLCVVLQDRLQRTEAKDHVKVAFSLSVSENNEDIREKNTKIRKEFQCDFYSVQIIQIHTKSMATQDR